MAFPSSQTEWQAEKDRPEAGNIAASGAALEDRVAAVMAEAWKRGEHLLAEELLARYPELAQSPESAVRLIYEEICLREEYGSAQPLEEILGRFPQWRAELEVVLDCHQLLLPHTAGPDFPEVGESLADLRLLVELGRGAAGRVFLATQPLLADRPVVLKLTPCHGQEHWSLARLQHTYIVPLYWAQDLPERNLRALCMPYLGGTTLARLLKMIRHKPPAQRTGQHLLQALDQVQRTADVPLPNQGPARKFLANATYVEAVCWMGVCLADALQHAHERGLVHLDLKPSNVLLAADGQPMLLDFHLAREPFGPDSPTPEWLGGTPEYMAPQQQLALDALRAGRPIPRPVDVRADVYALGLLLYQTLGGPLANANDSSSDSPLTSPTAQDVTADPYTFQRLERYNPHVSKGLAAIIAKCLAYAPSERYADAATLAADLKRHLGNLPLRGVRNRWTESWHKWRRRRPHSLIWIGLVLVLLGVTLIAGLVMLSSSFQQYQQAKQALADGQKRLQSHEYDEAERTLTRGRELAHGLFFNREQQQALDAGLRRARRAVMAEKLHELTDQLRFAVAAPSAAQVRGLEGHCRAIWEARLQIADQRATTLEPEIERRIQTDLLDLALLWTDLHTRQAPPDQVEQARREALDVLAEAQVLYGPSPILSRERSTHAQALKLTAEAAEATPGSGELKPRTAWEYYALGRRDLRQGDHEGAALYFAKAVELQPQGFWPNFYQGLCAYQRGQYTEAVNAFRVCIALAPSSAHCYVNRALALAALGKNDEALRDYDRALQIEPHFGAAALQRGILYYQSGQRLAKCSQAQRIAPSLAMAAIDQGSRCAREACYRQAVADFALAAKSDADPVMAHFNLALAYYALEKWTAAHENLLWVLKRNPMHPEARALLERLE